MAKKSLTNKQIEALLWDEDEKEEQIDGLDDSYESLLGLEDNDLINILCSDESQTGIK